MPLHLHDKVAEGAEFPWAGPQCGFTYAQAVLLGAQQDQGQAAHLRSAAARPRRCLPCAARCFQSPALRLEAVPCSLAAIWPITAEHSRCRLCSAPAIATRVRNRAFTRTAQNRTLSDTW